jgi:hypothetical protein
MAKMPESEMLPKPSEYRFSKFAIASVLINLPHIILLANYLFDILYDMLFDPTAMKERGIMGYMIILLWVMSGPLAMCCGIVSIVHIRKSPSVLHGKWLAILGIVLTMIVPTLGLILLVSTTKR